MPYEVDILPVGDGEKSGDAIALRFGNLSGPRSAQKVVVIDGGFTDTGNELVAHIKKCYRTDVVDLVIATHTDGDHLNGLFSVLEQLRVGELWMHRPWKLSREFASAYARHVIAEATFRSALKESLEGAVALEGLAQRKSIPIREPYAGTSFDDNSIYVAGPSLQYYTSLIADFRGTPTTVSAPTLLERATASIAGAARRNAEALDCETLTDAGRTSAENNSSVVTLLTVDADQFLFTSDVGMPALAQAVDFLLASKVDPRAIGKVQVPHHGSHHNIGPSVLNRLLGAPAPPFVRTRTAFVSCATNGAPKHPNKKVTNAFLRRGAPVFATQGRIMCFRGGVDGRPGYGTMSALPLYSEVDE